MTVFFKRAEQLFSDYEIPKEFQAKVISPFLSNKARATLAKLSTDVTSDYESMKAAILTFDSAEKNRPNHPLSKTEKIQSVFHSNYIIQHIHYIW